MAFDPSILVVSDHGEGATVSIVITATAVTNPRDDRWWVIQLRLSRGRKPTRRLN
jgi:hypothetical protein